MPMNDPKLGFLSEWRRWCPPWYGAYAILGAVAAAFTPILFPLLIEARGGHGLEIGVVMAMVNLGVLTAPLTGYVAQRAKAYRGLLMGSFVLIAISLLAFSAASTPALWALAAMAEGIGIGAGNTLANLIVVQFRDPAEWGPRINYLQTQNATGQAFGLAIAGVLGAPRGLWFAALLSILALTVVTRGLPVPGADEDLASNLNAAKDELRRVMRRWPLMADEIVSAIRPDHDLRAQLKLIVQSGFGRFLASWTLMFLASSAVGAFYVVLMRRDYAIAPPMAAGLYAVAVAVRLPCYAVIARYAAPEHPAAIFRWGVVTRLLGPAAMSTALLMGKGERWLVASLGFIVMEMAWAPLSVGATALTTQLSEISDGAAMGMFNFAGALAAVIGAVSGGMVAHGVGYGGIPVFATAAMLACLALSTSFPVQKGAEAEHHPSAGQEMLEARGLGETARSPLPAGD
jgi:MFS family permease